MSWIALAKYAVVMVLMAIVLFCAFLIVRNIRLIIDPPPPPPVDRLGPYTVKAVPTGGSILVKAGWRGRRDQLWKPMYLEAPAAGEEFSEESRQNMQRLAGASIVVEVTKDRIIDLERTMVIGDTIYGESGQDLAIAQLRAGLARCEKDAPALLKAAQAEAQKAKRGIWAEGAKWPARWESMQKGYDEIITDDYLSTNPAAKALDDHLKACKVCGPGSVCPVGEKLFKAAWDEAQAEDDASIPRPILRAAIVILWCVAAIAAVIGGVVAYFWWRSKT
jgi:hypothetical protein